MNKHIHVFKTRHILIMQEITFQLFRKVPLLKDMFEKIYLNFKFQLQNNRKSSLKYEINHGMFRGCSK